MLRSHSGRNMAIVIHGLAQLGYVGAYRSPDSQHFGVAQRRERVFLLARRDPGAGCPAEILAIAEGLSGHPAPSREAGARVAASLTRGADSQDKGGYAGRRQEDDYNIVSHALTQREAKGPDSDATSGFVLTHTLRAEGFDGSEDGTGRGTPIVAQNPDDCERWEEAEHSNTLAGHSTTTSEVVAQSLAVRGRRGVPQVELGDDGKANALLTPNGGRGGVGSGAVLATIPRRLTPTECERLQGFPDGWTAEGVDDDDKLVKQSDGPRYRQLGNAVTVNVAHWLGTQLLGLTPYTEAKCLSYVIRHKWFVFVAGLRVGAPVWRLLIHDWSKFLPVEWWPYVRYFYGGPWPTDQEMWNKFPGYTGPTKASVAAAFDRAWLHHQHANPHHWQHWILREDSGALKVLAMPEHFAREMVADWMGAGRAITGKWEAAEWYAKNREIIQLHEATRDLVEALLGAPS